MTKEIIFNGAISQLELNDDHLMIKPYHQPEALLTPYHAMITIRYTENCLIVSTSCFSFKSLFHVPCTVIKETIKQKGREDRTIYRIEIED